MVPAEFSQTVIPLERNYRVQNGCHNCQHVFRLDLFFCTLGAPERPKCDSVFMGECPKEFWQEDGENAKWDQWSEGREVLSQGVCDAWQTAEETRP